MNEEKRNIILFFAISILITVGYPYFFDTKTPVPSVVSEVINTPPAVVATNLPAMQIAERGAAVIAPEEPIHEIVIDTKSISGTISSCGLKIDNILLKNYDDSLDKGKSKKISIFGDMKSVYYSITGWSSDDKSLLLPNENTHWKADSLKLSESSPVVLTWDNGNGLSFEKHISIDDNFVITVVDKVRNYGNRTIALQSQTKVHREFENDGSNSTWTFYEGPLGYFSKGLEEISYSDIEKDGEKKYDTNGGWFGITDKYWLVAFIPAQNSNCKVSYKYSSMGNKKIYEVESKGDSIQVAPSFDISSTNNLFVGAKEVKTLDMYEEKLGIKHFDRALDFGCLYIMTRPLLYALAFAKDTLGNMGLAIILITLLIKLLLLPLANKSYRSMNRMKEIQPKIQAIQTKYADDKVKLGQAVSELYKKENINPVGGCLPSLVQSPVLFALYKVLYISIEMRQAPFIGWIHDLSVPDPLSIFNLFGLIPINLPSFLKIGIWPLLMGLSMLLQQKMGPKPTDPAQASMMMVLPIMFTFMFAQFPAGLVVYWTFSNVLSILQQYYIGKSCDNSKKEKQKNGNN
ncbi:membrane protein insertase YidC [Alphaproteobacteria bacterium]|nr:membrane protein insertase YidC [Alphaproteobacteria bacterium]